MSNVTVNRSSSGSVHKSGLQLYTGRWNRWNLSVFDPNLASLPLHLTGYWKTAAQKIGLIVVKIFALGGALLFDALRLLPYAFGLINGAIDDHTSLVAKIGYLFTKAVAGIETVLRPTQNFATLFCEQAHAVLRRIDSMESAFEARELWNDFLNNMAQECQAHAIRLILANKGSSLAIIAALREAIREAVVEKFKDGSLSRNLIVQRNAPSLPEAILSGYNIIDPTKVFLVPGDTCFVNGLFPRIHYIGSLKTWAEKPPVEELPPPPTC